MVSCFNTVYIIITFFFSIFTFTKYFFLLPLIKLFTILGGSYKIYCFDDEWDNFLAYYTFLDELYDMTAVFPVSDKGMWAIILVTGYLVVVATASIYLMDQRILKLEKKRLEEKRRGANKLDEHLESVIETSEHAQVCATKLSEDIISSNTYIIYIDKFLRYPFRCNSYLNSTAFNFQNPKTGVMLGIMELYDYIMFFLLLISIVVFVYLFIAVFESERLMKFGLEKKLPELAYFINNYEYTFKKAHDFEFSWTIVPGMLLIFMAFPSFVLLYSIDELVQPIYTISVVGNQWFWSYEYNDFNLHILFEHFIKTASANVENYVKKIKILGFLPRHFAEFYNMPQFISVDSVILPDDDLPLGYPRLLAVDQVLVLPIFTPIRLLVTSNDVIHSWAVPSFGVKMDAVPGRLNQISLTILFSGTSWGQCSELCGVNHGFMPIEIRAVEKCEFLEYIGLNAKATIIPYILKFDKIFNNPILESKLVDN